MKNRRKIPLKTIFVNILTFKNNNNNSDKNFSVRYQILNIYTFWFKVESQARKKFQKEQLFLSHNRSGHVHFLFLFAIICDFSFILLCQTIVMHFNCLTKNNQHRVRSYNEWTNTCKFSLHQIINFCHSIQFSRLWLYSNFIRFHRI